MQLSLDYNKIRLLSRSLLKRYVAFERSRYYIVAVHLVSRGGGWGTVVVAAVTTLLRAGEFGRARTFARHQLLPESPPRPAPSLPPYERRRRTRRRILADGADDSRFVAEVAEARAAAFSKRPLLGWLAVSSGAN